MLNELKGKLQAEVERLNHEISFVLPKEIEKALAHGDLRENSEYKAALERQQFAAARLTDRQGAGGREGGAVRDHRSAAGPPAAEDHGASDGARPGGGKTTPSTALTTYRFKWNTIGPFGCGEPGMGSMLIAAPITRAPPPGMSSASTMGCGESIAMTAALFIPCCVMNQI